MGYGALIKLQQVINKSSQKST